MLNERKESKSSSGSTEPVADVGTPLEVRSTRLAEKHLHQLRASGLTDKTIEALGFATIDSVAAREVLRWSAERPGDPSGLLIPYPTVSGYAKVRPDVPRHAGPAPKKVVAFDDHQYGSEPEPVDAKVIKYEAPFGSDAHCYVPLPICPELKDPEARLYITEGEKKAALMCQEGLPCIGIPGVSSGHDVENRRHAQDWGGEEFSLTPEATPYVTAGREVCVVFDSPDMETNIHVIRGAVRLARMIEARKAVPFVGYVPSVKGLPKTGIDDYFVDASKRRDPADRDVRLRSFDVFRERPAGPNEMLKWLAETKADNGWTKTELHIELRRAACWASVWHEGNKKRFNEWCRLAKSEFSVDLDVLKSWGAALAARMENGVRSVSRSLQLYLDTLNAGFALFRYPDGTEKIFSVNEKREATLLLSETHLMQALHDAHKKEFQSFPDDSWLEGGIELWKKECVCLTEDPTPFSFKGDALTFKRFDWEPTQGAHPAWDEFLSRLSDPDAFMAFVWSAFEMKNVSRQYLWLRGDGQDGKSSVLSALLGVFGQAATGISGSQLKDTRFLYSAIYGRRAVFYADCKNSKFGMSEFVRNVTSGDHVMVEFKGKTPFSSPLRLKLFVASNPKPEITGETADASRMLYIEVAESKSKDDPTWESRLRTELPAFLYSCQSVYARACPHHGNIPLSQKSRELRDDAIAAFEEQHAALFDTNFTVTPGSKTPANKVARRLRDLGLSNNQMNDFKVWMERVHNVKAGRSNSVRFYENVTVVEPAADVRYGRPLK